MGEQTGVARCIVGVAYPIVVLFRRVLIAAGGGCGAQCLGVLNPLAEQFDPLLRHGRSRRLEDKVVSDG
jgi:hypothetical protein